MDRPFIICIFCIIIRSMKGAILWSSIYLTLRISFLRSTIRCSNSMPSPTSVSPARRIRKRGRCIYISRSPLVKGGSKPKLRPHQLYSERQKLKARLKELQSQYKKLSFKNRRNIHYALACFLHALDLDIGKVIEKNTYLDGTTRDSKSEIIRSLLFDLLDIQYTHNYPLYAQRRTYWGDFYFSDSQDFHEHMSCWTTSNTPRIRNASWRTMPRKGSKRRRIFSSRKSISRQILAIPKGSAPASTCVRSYCN